MKTPLFDRLSVMLDCSRGAVYTVPTVCRLIDLLASMGYSELQLYTEDTYEIEEEPYFGHMRGRYTREELREIDAYAASHGIELVPCIQTLGHLGSIMYWKHFSGRVQDCGGTMLADSEETYALIDRMFGALEGSFRSRRVNIGMDEAYWIGRGKYYDLHGDTDHMTLLLRHLGRVCDIAARHGFAPMMWSDMFFHLLTGGGYGAFREDTAISSSLTEKIPAGLTLIYWDYAQSPEQYLRVMRAHRAFGRDIRFAGGAWTWMGYSPLTDYALRQTEYAVDACAAAGVRCFMMTLWGDCGAECSPFSALPTLFYLSARNRGIEDMAEIRAAFARQFGFSFDDMLALDLPNRAGSPRGYENCARYALFNDPFLGLWDDALPAATASEYRDAAAVIRAAAQRVGASGATGNSLAPLFEPIARLCDILAVKFDLGLRLRAAYQSDDRAALAAIAQQLSDLPAVVQHFYEAEREQWYAERKSFGFELHCYRLGGLCGRLRDCARRLADYLDGTLPSIPELAEDALPRNPDHPHTPEGLWAFGSIISPTSLG